MNAIEYTRKLRRTATISWLASLFLVLGLSGLRVLPFNEFLPFLALLLGMIPIGIFVYRNEAVCGACGGHMKIGADIPRSSIVAGGASQRFTRVFILTTDGKRFTLRE